MNQRLSTALALLLIAGGALFLVYAALTMRSAPVEHSRPPAVNPSPLGEGGLGEKRAGEGLRPETAPPAATAESATPPASSDTAEAAAPASSVPPAPVVAAPAKRPPDSSASADHAAAPRQAAIMWLTLALPLVFIVFVLMVVLRRLRPPPMKHTGPSDTTDLWREAGRRLK
jgi:hypothetical protein